MKKKTTQILPHISRLFPSRIVELIIITLIWALLLVLFIYNITLRLSQGYSTQQATLSLLKEPHNPQRYVDLANIYYAKEDYRNAYKQLDLADIVSNNQQSEENVLGSSSSFTQYVLQWDQERSSFDTNIEYWTSTLRAFPSYRDGYVQLASLYYGLGKTEEAKKYLHKALVVDPTATYIEDVLNSLNE